MLCIVGKNGTKMYRDGVNVLQCRFHLVWLVFEGSIPTCACFHSENFFVTCFCWIFLNCFLEIVREKRGGRGGRGEDAWSVSMKAYNCGVHNKQLS